MFEDASSQLADDCLEEQHEDQMDQQLIEDGNDNEYDADDVRLCTSHQDDAYQKHDAAQLASASNLLFLDRQCLAEHASNDYINFKLASAPQRPLRSTQWLAVCDEVGMDLLKESQNAAHLWSRTSSF